MFLPQLFTKLARGAAAAGLALACVANASAQDKPLRIGVIPSVANAATELAIAQAKKTLIQDHLDHCLEHVIGPLAKEQRRSIDEFKEITKYL